MTIKKPRWGLAKGIADDLTPDFIAPPIPVVELAVQNGVEVILANFTKYSKTVAGFCDFGEKKIYVNRDDKPIQQIFTTAHELGHWLLHRGFFEQHPEEYPVLARFQSPDNDDPLEQEANHFALNLLVPDTLLKRVIHASPAAQADVFGVSVTMMNHRLRKARD